MFSVPALNLPLPSVSDTISFIQVPSAFARSASCRSTSYLFQRPPAFCADVLLLHRGFAVVAPAIVLPTASLLVSVPNGKRLGSLSIVRQLSNPALSVCSLLF